MQRVRHQHAVERRQVEFARKVGVHIVDQPLRELIPQRRALLVERTRVPVNAVDCRVLVKHIRQRQRERATARAEIRPHAACIHSHANQIDVISMIHLHNYAFDTNLSSPTNFYDKGRRCLRKNGSVDVNRVVAKRHSFPLTYHTICDGIICQTSALVSIKVSNLFQSIW
jgi:hypothetical protein